MADAPLPTTATSRPSKAKSCFQLAEWNVAPAKDARPGRFGVAGVLRPPAAPTRTSAVMVPFDVSICQRCAPSSHAAPVTAWPNRT